MALLIFIAVLMFFMLLGMPIVFSLLLSSTALMFYLDTFDSQIIVQNLVSGTNSFPLLAVPFFILAGELMNSSGLTKRIINFAIALVGNVKGGLGYVAIIASIIFAGLSGSAVADTAALGAILIPMMVSAGYDKNQSTGLIAAGGIIAPIIPPSIALILFGITNGISIVQLFMAGIVPGLMLGIGLVTAWTIIARRGNFDTLKSKTKKSFLKVFRESIWALVLPVIIIVGIRFGVFTPTEAAAVAVFYTLFVGVFIYKELNVKKMYDALVNSARITSVVVFLSAAAMVSAWLITIANIPAALITILDPFLDSKFILLSIIFLLILIVGMVMDVIPNILVLGPILTPVIIEAGIDPVYFGIIFVLTCCIGLLTPPVGVVLNVASGVAKIPIEDTVKGVFPFLIAHIIVVFLLIVFPSIITVPLEFLTR